MATIYRTLSVKADKRGMSEILLRFKQGKLLDQRVKTNIFINPEYWKNGQINTSSKKLITEEVEYHFKAKKALDALENHLLEKFSSADKKSFTKQWAQEVVMRYQFPEKYSQVKEEVKNNSLIVRYNEFLEKHKLSEWRIRGNRVVLRALQRFEIYKGYSLTLDNLTPDILQEFEIFLKTEHALWNNADYQKVYKLFPEKRQPLQRGGNTISGIFTKLRTMVLWHINRNNTTNNPFSRGGYKIEECKYGTPIYITIEERNRIYRTDFSNSPRLALYRDIFVFQCLVGCRVGDLFSFRKSNIINGALQYIPSKTMNDRAKTLLVPLNETAKEILSKYESEEERLFPYTYEQDYNKAIKEIFLAAGITRKVVIVNPTTGEEEIRPINEIASSHLARRTFVGNLYKKVKDPNLVGALSGHKEGSKAFARYREIDNDMKKELVSLLD